MATRGDSRHGRKRMWPKQAGPYQSAQTASSLCDAPSLRTLGMGTHAPLVVGPLTR